MNYTLPSGSLEQDRIEDVLTEIARQLLEHGGGALDQMGQWGCTSICVEICPENVRPLLHAGACRVGCGPGEARELGGLASYIDHTLLKPEAKTSDIDKICTEALQHRFASVCVNTCYARRCAEILQGSGVLTCCVVGFPLGAMLPEAKAFEARRALEEGACEIDMVINVGVLKSGDDDYVRRDIEGVAKVCHEHGAKLKVILETCLLTDDEKVRACELCVQAGADFVKTSTGFNKGGATRDDIALMRRVVGPVMGVKASGGVRDAEGAAEMIEAGATRIGASASVAIVKGEQGGAGY